jgi:hypothetical protein
MSNLPPIFKDQRKVDADHLKLLAIFHFVCAGFALLGIVFICLHFTIFNAVFANPKIWQDQKQGPPPAEIFVIFKVFYGGLGLWFLGSGVLNVMSGVWIRARKNRTFSLVVAGVNCLHIPLGTVLGVFTIVVLIRDSVREVYDSNPEI